MKRGMGLWGIAVLAMVVAAWLGTGLWAAPIQWIWFNEGDPAKSAPAETRFFRKVFTLERAIDEADLDITADNQFTVWVNGVKAGSGDDWKKVQNFDVKQHLVVGANVIAVEARNTEGSAGLIVRLNYLLNGASRTTLVSDASWKSAKSVTPGWEKADFDDGKWGEVKVLGTLGKGGPWRDVVWGKGGRAGNERFGVPEGFKVELAVKIPAFDERFSIVNMCFDNQGRLLLSREQGPIYLCTEPDKDGVLQKVAPYCEQVKNCQGMCWVRDALLLVGNGPQGTGLYRVQDTNKDDKTDQAALLHRFQGGMGEHGPHAIIHGPDDWLYLVIGNHAWAQLGPEAAKNGPNPEKLAANSPLFRWPTGRPGPDQGKAGTNEDVLLPRQNDARGHAANILAPGGTIWRLDHQAKNMSLVTAGFRNHYDAAFSPTGELFTFDSDMEWDEALPWYRAVRVCHCTPGADFVWRTGAANTPDYYLDSLAPTAETGRGSPVGVEFYDHDAFPEKYRGAFFISDWSLGIIYAVLLERDGGSYKAKTEKFCTGNPLNVTDCAVGPDGALYFTLGGRNTQGGVYRIVADKAKASAKPSALGEYGRQPLSAWSRERTARGFKEGQLPNALVKIAEDAKQLPLERIKALTLLHIHGSLAKDTKMLNALAKDPQPEVRAEVVRLLGLNGSKEGNDTLLTALQDSDALVRRRACEALIRAGVEPPIDPLWSLLADKDRFVRTAARLVLQRIDPKKWVERVWKEDRDGVAYEAIVALCKTNQAAPYTEQIFQRIQKANPGSLAQPALDYLRTLQLALVHTTERPAVVRALASSCDQWSFPNKDWRINRELAILLTYFRREELLSSPVHAKLLRELLRVKDERMQQIHYFYCLRLLTKDQWTAPQKDEILAWYESTKTWQGGASFTPFLENILRDLSPIFTPEDSAKVLARAEEMPAAALALLRFAPPKQLPPPKVLADLYDRLPRTKPSPRSVDLRAFLLDTLIKSTPPTADNLPYLVKGLESTSPVTIFNLVETLKKLPAKPKPDDPGPYRALLAASGKLDVKNRWKAVELLRHWSNNKQFGADKGDWQPELTAWSRWFTQTFPKEPSLPSLSIDKPVESKYKYEELLAFLDAPAGKKGDVSRGRQVFEKAQCLKCHKFGKEGEGLGPDLSTLSKRFKRSDTLEALFFPSKVISDQYRSMVIVTKKGQQFNGLAAPQGDVVTVLLSDGTKINLTKSEIEQQFASLISVMPEKLLDTLTKDEIADLFAFMESEPK